MNKKLLSLVFTVALVLPAIAQDSEGSKSFRFGLKGAPSLNWYTPEDSKKFENAGLNFKFAWGLITEFKLAEVASLATGLQIDNDGGKLTFKDSPRYIVSDEEAVYINKIPVSFDSLGRFIDTTGKFKEYILKDRNYSVKYVTLPAIIKMKTKEIGYFTYFGQFGVNLSFKTKGIVDDEVDDGYTLSEDIVTLKDMDISDDFQLFRTQLSIGGGAEYNIAGSTSLVFGINYNRGFSNVLKKESNYLYSMNKTTSGTSVSYSTAAVNQKATSNNIALTVGILF